MKQQLLTKTFILIWLTLPYSQAIAQETCSEKLIRANDFYENGQFTEAIAIVKGCEKETLTETEKWQANRLLSLSYLGNNQTSQAKKAAEDMLELNPTYKPSKVKDPPELGKLLSSVKVIPKFSVGVAVTIGGNYSYPVVKASYQPTDYSKTYTSEPSWQVGFMTGYHLNRIISLNGMLIASSKRYSVSYAIPDWEMKVSDQLTYLDLPLFARFVVNPQHKLGVFIDAGGFAGYLLQGQQHFQRTYTPDQETTSLENLNTTSQRNRWEYGMVFGGGLKYNLGNLSMALDLKYYLSYANITDGEKRYDNPTTLYQYYYINDDIRINNLAVSLSLIYHVNYQVLR